MTHKRAHLDTWRFFQDSMYALNNVDPAQIPPPILANLVAQSSCPISETLFESLTDFFVATGHLGDSSSDESPFTGYPDTSDSD